MSDTTGFGETAAQSAVENITDGGIEILLATTAVNYTDSATDIDTKTDASETVTEANVTITPPADFSGTVDLTNDNAVEFGALSIGVVEEVVIRSQTDNEQWVLADETNNPELTGEEYTIEADTVLYSLGNVV